MRSGDFQITFENFSVLCQYQTNHPPVDYEPTLGMVKIVMAFFIVYELKKEDWFLSLIMQFI